MQFHYDLYRGEHYWIAPLRLDTYETLNPRKNPFFEHGEMQLFLAVDARGKVVGRIAGIVNGMHLKKYEDATGFFGFFDCVDDYEVAHGLLETVEAWLRERGISAVRGPTNPSMNDVSGLLVGGFDRYPSVLMPYNHSYYGRFLTDYGFERAITMWAYYLSTWHALPQIERLSRGKKLIMRRYPSLSVRTMDMDRFHEDASAVRDIYNAAWASNWGHVPMTDGEFGKLAKQMKQIVDPRMVFFIEDDGTPVAFSASLPNLNNALRAIPSGRLLPTGILQLLLRAKFGGIFEVRTALMGVLPEYRGRGLDGILNHETILGSARCGYAGGELSWVLDTNRPLRNFLEAAGCPIDKEYALFEKQL